MKKGIITASLSIDCKRVWLDFAQDFFFCCVVMSVHFWYNAEKYFYEKLSRCSFYGFWKQKLEKMTPLFCSLLCAPGFHFQIEAAAMSHKRPRKHPRFSMMRPHQMRLHSIHSIVFDACLDYFLSFFL